VIFGCGIIGLGVIQSLKALDYGLNRIVAVDVSEKRLEMAARMGADDLINAGREDLYSKVQDLLGVDKSFGRPELQFPKADIVYDCVGYIQDRPEPPVLQQAIVIARPRTGRIVAHGVFEAPLTLDFSIPVFKQIQIIGSFAMEPSEVIEGIELMRSKTIDREELISHEFPLDRAGEAFGVSCNIGDSIKVLIQP
jgi:threonine dehydrogenase-like Zn-dependent dehydrogenase